MAVIAVFTVVRAASTLDDELERLELDERCVERLLLTTRSAASTLEEELERLKLEA